jgi:hypothetical protein
MNPTMITIPDTVNGAIMLSIIDFFLSFIVISFIGFVLSLFPLLNRTWKKTAEKIEAPAPKQVEVDMTTEDHIAAISAAVTAMIGAHRIVHIEPAAHGPGWTVGGRAAHHQSHAVPHHAHTPRH